MKGKILYFVTEDWYFCSHRLALAKAAKESGLDTVVVTRVRDHAGPILQAGLRLIPFELSRRSMNPVRELGVLWRLITLYKREKPDIVHHVAMKPVLYGSLAARLSGVHGVVNALAGLGWLFTSGNWKARLIKPWVRFVFRALVGQGIVIVQNPDDAAVVRNSGVMTKRVRMIRGSGVDTVSFRSQPEVEEQTRVVLPARMLRDKGVVEFVEAARMLRTQGLPARFVLVGDPDPENPASLSTAQLNAWKNEGIIEWQTWRDDMPAVYKGAHVVCLPSYREGLPKVLLEAAASGRAIVATDVPGCREIVRDGDNGLLVPPRDAKALAEALCTLVNNPELRRRMGQLGRKIAEEEFSVEKVIGETLAVYREVRIQ